MPDLRDSPFSDLDVESDATRRVLAAVPWDRADWKPHPKSMPLGSLARHVATLPRFGLSALTTDTMDATALRVPPDEIGSAEDLVALWDETSAALRAALADADRQSLDQQWTMTMNDGAVTLVDGPRAEVVRRWTLSHIAHHRGQLTVYLRLLDVPVPGTYGPSADDRSMMGG